MGLSVYVEMGTDIECWCRSRFQVSSKWQMNHFEYRHSGIAIWQGLCGVGHYKKGCIVESNIGIRFAHYYSVCLQTCEYTVK